MGVTYFKDLGEVADAGFADNIQGRVNGLVAQLPRDCLYWISGENPTSTAPYAEFREGKVVIDVRDEEPNLLALGVRLPPGAVKDTAKSTGFSTLFDYNSATYEIVHRTVPLK